MDKSKIVTVGDIRSANNPAVPLPTKLEDAKLEVRNLRAEVRELTRKLNAETKKTAKVQKLEDQGQLLVAAKTDLVNCGKAHDKLQKQFDEMSKEGKELNDKLKDELDAVLKKYEEAQEQIKKLSVTGTD